MSLGIAFKGFEGVVLAADSRVTLSATLPNNVLLPASYDNATKLLSVKGQRFVGAVTYGAGAIGTTQPRTAHSFLPEFEADLTQANVGRLSVADFSQRLSDFFLARWQAANMPAGADPMVFLVGGFDEGEPYGKVFELQIPTAPTPNEKSPNEFGITWGGQSEIVQRLLIGFDQRALPLIQSTLNATPGQMTNVEQNLRANLGTPIPFQFLPLQDCVDLAIFLVHATAKIQTWQVSIRGVGGAIDVATITRTDGFVPVQQKRIRGA